MEQISKLHPGREWRANKALNSDAGLKAKQALIPGNQGRVTVVSENQVRGVAPERVVHRQNREEGEPISDDLPVWPHKLAQVVRGSRARVLVCPGGTSRFAALT